MWFCGEQKVRIVIIGAALILTACASEQEAPISERANGLVDSAGRSVKSGASYVVDKTKQGAGYAGDKAKQAGSYTKEKAIDLGEGTKKVAGQVGDATKKGTYKALDATGNLVEKAKSGVDGEDDTSE